MFVVFDDRFRDEVLDVLTRRAKDVEMLYKAFVGALGDVYADEKTASRFVGLVFYNEPLESPALAIRVVPALCELLLRAGRIPCWVSFVDLDLADRGLVHLVQVFSSASRVSGIPGRVLVAQFSDEDVEVEAEFRGKKLKFTSLRGAMALVIALALRTSHMPVHQIHDEFKKCVRSLLQRAKT